MKKLLMILFLLSASLGGFAQRTMDKMDRGLIAMKVSNGVYVNWRINGEEYYDVTYNVYRDGTKLNETPLSVSNHTDKSGTTSSTYTVTAVVNGVEQAQCKPASVWASSYKEIKLTHEGIKSTLIPNDACCADVDGDGEVEILLKLDNESEMAQSYPKEGPVVDGVATKEYSIFEVLKLDGTRLWWVNCGPNMGDFQNNEQNIVGYDWDEDGKAEVVMRLLEGSTIHFADGTSKVIGSNGLSNSTFTNYRAATGGGTNWFMHDGKEFLLYCNGQTGEIYDCIPFPLARLESGETDLNAAWGDGYGHRSNKFFYGAPYLDGRHPSIFLARGIYTRHKMAAYDVNKTTHKLTQRWKWYNNTGGPWKGQGYHNYAIADVDWDGRDEIVFGSMVIDDNGKGLSTTGYGHGDAQHCSDLNPYVHGQEQFCCNEDEQGFNYRDATTSKVYAATLHVGKDVGRAMAGNFTEAFPGGLGTAWGDPISTVTNTPVSGLGATGVNSNFRIYWDGDLVSETFNYLNGKNTEGCVAKYGSWSPIYTCAGSLTNNDTKGTPCYQGDILGDWREEIIMRTGDRNLRIYSTPTSTTYRIPSLWADHQYRNAMVWQMCGYNQPPHPSFFLGKTDGITVAPPPLTMNGRTEVANGGTIDASLNGKSVIVCETNNSAVTLAAGAQPTVLTFNVPTWVQGTAGSECSTKDTKINYLTYTCNVTGGGLAGDARLVKQGDGVLNLPNAEFTHTGNTDIWAGVLNFDGSMKQSPLWLNRFAELNSTGTFRSITTSYASIIRPGGADERGTITTDSLKLGFGSRIIVDLYSEGKNSDKIATKYLSIETKTGDAWVKAGPTYLSPVIEVVPHMATGATKLEAGKYVIATIEGDVTKNIVGKLGDIVLEGMASTKKVLSVEGNNLVLEILDSRDATDVTWTGAQSNVWDLNTTENFKINGKDEATTFVANDNVTFNNDATNKSVTLEGTLIPNTMTVDNTAAYTFGGVGAIDGTAKFVKQGTGIVTMSNNSTYTGGNHLKAGTTKVSLLAYELSEVGNLGGITTNADLFTIEDGATLQNTANVHQGSAMKMVGTDGGIINAGAEFHAEGSISGTLLEKKGSGTLFLKANNANLTKLNLTAGSLAIAGGCSPKLINVTGGTTSAPVRLYDDGQNTTVPINLEAGKFAALDLSYANYTAYSNKLTGEGTLTINPRNSVSRVRITGDWSAFAGTVKQTSSIWLPLDMSATCSKMTLDVAASCTAANVPGRTLTIGAVTGNGSLCNAGCDFKSQATVSGTATWNIGNSNNKDFTFAGTINNNSNTNTVTFNKVGTCKMTMTGAGSNLTTTVGVKAGELILNNSTTKAMLGTGTLTVSSGATLSGSALLSNTVNINAGGTLRAGITETSRSGTLKFNTKNVTVNGTMQLYITSKSAYTKFAEIGTLALNGTLKIGVKEALSIPEEGWTFPIISASSINLGTNLKFDVAEGYIIDTTNLATDGTITLKIDPNYTGINSISADELEGKEIFTLDGVRVQGTPAVKGIYIVNGRKVMLK